MKRRRDFLKWAGEAILALGLLGTPMGSILTRAHEESETKVIPKDIDRSDLQNWNPKGLDTSNLEITPLKDFGTMGLDDHSTSLEVWRLIVDGHVGRPLQLSYDDVTSLPTVERPVLMICPGFFANYGFWKGVSMRELLEQAALDPGVTHMTFRGPEGNYEKVLRVPANEAFSNMVFVAYQVNGETLPVKHGFPLRVVAEGYYGYEWVKYVCRITADSIEFPLS